MTEGYSKIFWGFIFITFHINLGSIQLLPNFIGYIIIYYGIKGLAAEYKNSLLKESSVYCSILVFMSFIVTVITFITGGDMIKDTFFNIIWMNVFNIVEIIMIYKLLNGSCEILKGDNSDLYDNYNNRADVYVILAAIVAVSNNINMIFMSDVLATLMAVFALALRVWIIVMHRKRA